MKTRTLIRKQGWVPVDVPATELNSTAIWYTREEDKENLKQHLAMKEWCDQFVGAENYASSLQRGTALHNFKRFVFKNPKHATLFRMRWLTS